MAKITFLKSQQTLELKEGTDFIRIPYIFPHSPLKFGCCKGQCATCAIKIEQGDENLSPKTEQEKATLDRLKLHSHRLACQCSLKGDIIIDL